MPVARGDARGQQRHGHDEQQVAPTQPPAEQTGKQLPHAATSVGGPGDRHGQADQDEEFGELRWHQVDTGHRRRHLGDPHEGDRQAQQQQDRMGDRGPPEPASRYGVGGQIRGAPGHGGVLMASP